MLASARLTVLDLSDNAFGPDGVKGIEKLLKSVTCFTLQELRLNNCGMGIGGGKVYQKIRLTGTIKETMLYKCTCVWENVLNIILILNSSDFGRIVDSVSSKIQCRELPPQLEGVCCWKESTGKWRSHCTRSGLPGTELSAVPLDSLSNGFTVVPRICNILLLLFDWVNIPLHFFYLFVYS